MTVSYLVLVLSILILIGYFSRKLRIVDERFSKNLSNFLFDIAYPAMIIESMQFAFSLDSLKQSFRLIVISIAVLIVSKIVAAIVTRLMKADKKSKGVIVFSIMYSNFTFMAIPIVEELYGKEILFYLAIFTAVMRIAYNTFGVNEIAKSLDKESGVNFKNIINPPLVAIGVGLIIYIFSIQLPYPLEKTIEMLSDTVSPFGMVITGLILAEYPVKNIIKEYRVYIIALARLIIVPLIVVLMSNIFNFTEVERQLSIIISAMPVASTCVMIAKKYEADSKLAAGAAFMTTILSIGTIPLILLLV